MMNFLSKWRYFHFSAWSFYDIWNRDNISAMWFYRYKIIIFIRLYPRIFLYMRIYWQSNIRDHDVLLGHFNGLMQKRCNSSALAMELRLLCIKPSMWWNGKVHTDCFISTGSCQTDSLQIILWGQDSRHDDLPYLSIWITRFVVLYIVCLCNS